MKMYIIPLLLIGTLTGSAFADPIIKETHPVAGDLLKDFRIDQCSGIRGFGYYVYGLKKNITALSDFCLDEEKREFITAEKRDGFELVEKSKNGRAYEILASGNDKYSRIRMAFMQDVDMPDCTAPGLASLDYNIPSGKMSGYKGIRYARSTGYTIPSTSQNPLNPKTTTLIFALRDFTQAELPNQSSPNHKLPPGADMLGELSFDGNKGVFSITEGNGYWVGEAGGQMNLTIGEAGEVTISGNLNAKNHRLAGHEPHEWISMTAEVPFMRGHILGADGREFKSYGVARGTYIDASGKTHSFRASAQLHACFDKP